jgi:hypothetical protein
VLPIRTITPGALNTQSASEDHPKNHLQARMDENVRQSLRYTNALKLKQMLLYQETGPPSAYEEDHLIPLELGVAPRNPKNLWPEPRSQAKKSDPLETRLKRQVCKRFITPGESSPHDPQLQEQERVMRAYALIELGDQEAIDLFLREEDAERALAECLRDEPDWAGMLYVARIEFDDGDVSLN